MKLNNKGFAITGILYGLLILFALLVGSYLTILTAKKNRLDSIVTSIEEEYNKTENDKEEYTIKYDANGGSGAPNSQTKTKGVALTLSSTKPTKLGYTFSNWNTNQDGSGTSYQSGGSYTSDSDATLYAVWKLEQHTLNLNKGTGIRTIYYKINGASSYTSSTSNVSLSVNYGSEYYYYGVASTGYSMSSCTSASSPCKGIMGTSNVTKTLSATATSSGPFTVIITVLESEETRGTTSNGTFTATNVYTQGLTRISCTNGATATVSGETVTVTNITANTICNIG